MMNFFNQKRRKFFVVILMSLLVLPRPTKAHGGQDPNFENKMIATEVALAESFRQDRELELKELLKTTSVQEPLRAALEKQGLSITEIDSRLAALSDQEVKDLSLQVKAARAGGDILVAVLLVVLIIYLLRRI